MNTLLVTAYTPGYRDLYERLKASCDALGLDLYAEPYESTGDWVRNGHVKPSVLWRARLANGERPVAWVDADAIIRKRPVLFDCAAEMGLTAAFHTVPKTGEVLSGTVWASALANGSANGGLFLWRWVRLAEEFPGEWDQKLMARAAKAIKDEFPETNIGALPAEYCWIDFMSEPRWGGPREPVIEHFQASRQVRQGTRQL